jgi:hypothetical protein
MDQSLATRAEKVNQGEAMKQTRTFVLTALLLAPLATLHAKENSPGVPRTGKFRADFFQALETSASLASNAWN